MITASQIRDQQAVAIQALSLVKATLVPALQAASLDLALFDKPIHIHLDDVAIGDGVRDKLMAWFQSSGYAVTATSAQEQSHTDITISTGVSGAQILREDLSRLPAAVRKLLPSVQQYREMSAAAREASLLIELLEEKIQQSVSADAASDEGVMPKSVAVDISEVLPGAIEHVENAFLNSGFFVQNEDGELIVGW